MKNKKGFILYADIQNVINKLSDDYAGKLFKHILAYVNDENPTTNDLLLEIAFEPIKQQLKRDLWTFSLIFRTTCHMFIKLRINTTNTQKWLCIY